MAAVCTTTGAVQRAGDNLEIRRGVVEHLFLNGLFPHFSDNAHGFEEETGTATVQTGALTEQIVDFRRVTAAVGNTTNTQ